APPPGSAPCPAIVTVTSVISPIRTRTTARWRRWLVGIVAPTVIAIMAIVLVVATTACASWWRAAVAAAARRVIVAGIAAVIVPWGSASWIRRRTAAATTRGAALPGCAVAHAAGLATRRGIGGTTATIA